MPNVKQNKRTRNNNNPTNRGAGNNTPKPSKKSNRKSRNLNSARNDNLSKVRHPGTIITDLATATEKIVLGRDSWKENPYACCRLGGKAPSTVPSIPDGCGGKHIATCLYVVDRIANAGSSSILIQTRPYLPCFAFITSNGGATVNGTTLASNVTGPAGVPLPFFQGAGSGPGSLANTADIYNASTMRIVSMRYRVTYTGPVTTAAGAIYAFDQPNTLSPVGETNATSATAVPPATGIYFTTTDASGSAASILVAPINTPIYQEDSGFFGFGVTRNLPAQTQVYRPEQGCLLIPKHRTNKFANVPVVNIPFGITASNTATTGTTGNFGMSSIVTRVGASGPIGAYNGGFISFDTDWSGGAIMLDGINADASYVLETMICVEMAPASNSPFYSLAKDSPPANSVLMDKIQKHLNSVEVSMPATDPR